MHTMSGTGNLNAAGSEAGGNATNDHAITDDANTDDTTTVDTTTGMESADNYDMIKEHPKFTKYQTTIQFTQKDDWAAEIQKMREAAGGKH